MSKGNNKKSLFWISYSDLMTSLFFTMLVLFVVVVIAMGRAQQGVKEERDYYKSIVEIEEQFKVLTKSNHLKYDSVKRVFYVPEFEGKEIFYQNSDTIKNEYIGTVDSIGRDIKGIIRELNDNGRNFKYQLVIEGTAAIPFKSKMTGSYNPDSDYAYNLSYRRSLALYRRWQNLGFRKYNTEIVIAGSGFNGINRDSLVEENNKRFVVHIIPKVQRPE